MPRYKQNEIVGVVNLYDGEGNHDYYIISFDDWETLHWSGASGTTDKGVKEILSKYLENTMVQLLNEFTAFNLNPKGCIDILDEMF